MGFGMMLVGLCLMGAGLFVTGLEGLARWVAVGFGAIVFIVGAIVTTITSLYRKTSADQAFVRTGMGGSRVVMDAGAIVLPVVHRVLDVNLRTMKLAVNPRGRNALITRDNLRSDVLAQFYIRVQAEQTHILNAARSLGQNSVNAETVEALVSEKLVSALRAIASQMDLFEIHTRRDEFAEKVKEHVRADLEENGLLLESVTISELDQTDPGELSDNNVFDAQGKKKITEITAAAGVERNKLERDAERQRAEKDVETRLQVLELERRRAEAEATQAAEVAKIKATKEREAQSEAQKKLIAAKQVIEQDKIKQQTEAEVQAYTRVKQAEGEQEAAQKQAAAKLHLAEAEAQSRKLIAAGEAAQQMVPVQVDRERVNIKQAEVAVEAQALENRQKFAEAGIELEIQRLRISADREVQIAMAEAIGKALSSSKMTLFGSPEMASTMLQSMAKGMGVRTMIEGFTGNGAGSHNGG